jgi:hypothetical protein
VIKNYFNEVPLNGLPSKVYENLPVGSNITMGTDRQTDTQTGDMISLFSLLGIRLKRTGLKFTLV